MRKLFLVLFVTVCALAFCQDIMSNKAKKDSVVSDSAFVQYAGMVLNPGGSFTQKYYVVTDSIVYQFGLVYSRQDSTFKKELSCPHLTEVSMTSSNVTIKTWQKMVSCTDEEPLSFLTPEILLGKSGQSL